MKPVKSALKPGAPVASPILGSHGRVSQHIQLNVQYGGSMGAAKEVFEHLAANAVQVIAHTASLSHAGSELLLVTSNAARAQAVLADAGFVCRTERIVAIETERCPGAVALLGLQLVEHGIGVMYSYVSWREGENLFAVFQTTDNARAFKILVAKGRNRPAPSRLVEPAVLVQPARLSKRHSGRELSLQKNQEESRLCVVK